ncbi:hypothetical protein V1514DRAFT_329182 [Lipomyces japonicus]|uniref:uncharacterized protein n=1 Tax=Lipomyces japonicus TaxID=56871 RepID=UPI0034CED014
MSALGAVQDKAKDDDNNFGSYVTSPEPSTEKNDLTETNSQARRSHISEMVPLVPSPRDGNSPGPAPLPAPKPVIGKVGNELRSILEQFDPLSLHSPSEQQSPSISRTASSSSTSTSLSFISSRPVSPSAKYKSFNASNRAAVQSSSHAAASSELASQQNPSHETTERQTHPRSSGQADLPKPEEQPAELPFDFQRFLEQLRHKGADPLARYLKSFLHEFGKRSWTVREQVKIVQDFQNFISPRIGLYPPFNNLPDTEISNAVEGMEKLIMNRLYAQTFSPEIPRSRRTFSHEEDLLRDNVLDQKMQIWSWIKGEHLDLDTNIIDSGERFVLLAEDELLKINNYRAPRDKVICILNSCKVIFGLLRQTKTEESADKFLPILIYVVLKAQPKHLISNVQYIMRFRSSDKLNGEAGYYLSSLQGAISFIETLDRNSLNITGEEFEKRVEESVAMIQEKVRPIISSELSQIPEPRHATSSITSTPPARSLSPTTVASHVQALSATFAAPFKQISKLFDSDDTDDEDGSSNAHPAATAASNMVRRTRSLVSRAQSAAGVQVPTTSRRVISSALPSPVSTPVHDAATARQVSKEDLAVQRQARRLERKEHKQVVETLHQMFPKLDVDLIDDVVVEKHGQIGEAVDACLALQGGGTPSSSTPTTPLAEDTDIRLENEIITSTESAVEANRQDSVNVVEDDN